MLMTTAISQQVQKYPALISLTTHRPGTIEMAAGGEVRLFQMLGV